MALFISARFFFCPFLNGLFLILLAQEDPKFRPYGVRPSGLLLPGQASLDPSFAFRWFGSDEFKSCTACPKLVKMTLVVIGIGPIVLYVAVPEQVTVSVGMPHDV